MAKTFRSRNGLIMLAVGALVILLIIVGVQQRNQPKDVTLTQLLADLKTDINHHQVDTLTAGSSSLTLQRSSQQSEQASVGQNFSLTDALRDNKIDYSDPAIVKVQFPQASPLAFWGGLAFDLLVPLLIIVFFILILRQAQGSNNQALSFGKSRARMFLSNKPAITFADVAGVDEAKQELQEIVEFLKFPDKFNALGARIQIGRA